MGMLAASVIVTAALAAGACKPAVPPVPGKGGPPWTQLTSEHFVLWTDASAARGRALVREMEHVHQVVYGVALPDMPREGKIVAIALRDSDEVGAYIPEGFIAWAFSSDVLRQPAILYAADTDEEDGHVVIHELVHSISWNAIRTQPRWFSEGLAKFFEGMRIDARRGKVDVGAPDPTMLDRLRRERLRHAAEVMACTELSCMDGRFYTTVWAIYAFLANTRGADLVRFQVRLGQLPDDPMRAWREVFPDLPPSDLDGALREWLLNGKRTVWHFDVTLDEPTITERLITDAEVFAMRAVLRHVHAPEHPQVARDLSEALALDPTLPLARMLDVTLDHPLSVDDARAMTVAHPDDWRAWWMLANALDRTGDEAHAALREVCRLAALDPAVWSPWICSSP